MLHRMNNVLTDNVIAYSKYFDSHIRVTRFVSNTLWWFKLTNEYGQVVLDKEFKAQTNYKEFKWTKIREDI